MLVEEIDKTFPSPDDPVTFAKTQDMPYLNAVLLETMRVMFAPCTARGANFILARLVCVMLILSSIFEIHANDYCAQWL